jgi:uncharacterized protein (DUF58 family)
MTETGTSKSEDEASDPAGGDGPSGGTTDPGADESGRSLLDLLPTVGQLFRGLFTIVVIAMVGVGIVFLTSPGELATLSIANRFRAFVEGSNWSVQVLAQALGAAIFLFVLIALAGAWRTGSVSEFKTAVNDRITGVSTTGAGREIDEKLAALWDIAGTGGQGGERTRLQYSLRSKLEQTAITVVARTEDCPTKQAGRLLETGEWTDDPRATTFFSDTDPPWLIRIRDVASFTPTAVRRASHVVEELQRRLEETETSFDDGDDTRPSNETESDRVTHAVDRDSVVQGSGRIESPGKTDVQGSGEGGPVDATDGRGAPESDGAAATPEYVVAEADGTGSVRQRNLGHAAGLLAIAVGIATLTPVAVLLGVVVVVYGLVDVVTTEPRASIEITREVGSGQPMPRDRVKVRTTVTNVGDRVLPDVRIVDGVPDPLPLLEGSPGIHTALRPGESDTITYSIRAKRGTFTFEETEAILRNLGGTNAVSADVLIETPIRCSTFLDDFPVRNRTDDRVGVVQTDSGGKGIEFYATREYRESDPMNRIDWNHLAKRNELTTIQYREQRTTTMVLLIDSRDVANVAPDPTELGAVDLSVYAAERTFLTLLDRKIDVGVLTYTGRSLQHVTPDAGDTQRTRLTTTVRDISEHYDMLTAGAATAGKWTTINTDALREIRQRLPSTAQVVIFSPVIDDFAFEASQTLQASGHPVTVFSPAAVGDDSLGQQAVQLERSARLQAIRDLGVYVVDWDTSDGVETAVTRVTRRHRS